VKLRGVPSLRCNLQFSRSNPLTPQRQGRNAENTQGSLAEKMGNIRHGRWQKKSWQKEIRHRWERNALSHLPFGQEDPMPGLFLPPIFLPKGLVVCSPSPTKATQPGSRDLSAEGLAKVGCHPDGVSPLIAMSDTPPGSRRFGCDRYARIPSASARRVEMAQRRVPPRPPQFAEPLAAAGSANLSAWSCASRFLLRVGLFPENGCRFFTVIAEAMQ
jgi:hypothetical protein